MRAGATPEQIAEIVSRLEGVGGQPHVSSGTHRTVIGAGGDRTAFEQFQWEALPGVEKVIPVIEEYKFVARDNHPEGSVVAVGDVRIGGGGFTVIAGPCAVESRDQLFKTAEAVKDAGASILRGDAFKPRSSPYAFQGMGEKALELLAEARQEFGLPFVAEVIDPRDVDLVAGYADLVRVGTRNMSNFPLLAEVGRQPRPVLLKRGRTATVSEWLNAAEYVYKEGNHDVVLVERGIRTFETAARNTLDLTAVPLLRGMTHLPVLVDPSHATGKRDLVPPLSKASLAVGADGLLVDVHPTPDMALVDGAQALLPSEFEQLMGELAAMAAVLGVRW